MYYRKVFRLAVLFTVLFLLVVSVSLPARVRTIRTRQVTDAQVYLNPDARLTFNRLLNNRMIELRATTDAQADSNYVQVKFSIEIDTGDLEWDSKFEATFIKALEPNATWVVANDTIMDIITSMDDITSFDYFEEALFDDDNTYPTIDMDFAGDPLDIIANLSLPEGKFIISIALQGMKTHNDTFIDDPAADKDEISATFLVVNIPAAGVTIEQTPTMDVPVLRWSLPQIPNYSIVEGTSVSGRTASRITITGPGMNYSRVISHDPPSDSGIKGYPSNKSNLPEGIFELVLPANLAQMGGANMFRMGGDYTFKVEFLDWNNREISDPSQVVNTLSGVKLFPVVNVEHVAPRGEIDTRLPIFEWDFDEYEPWVDHYLLYIGNRTPIVVSGGSTNQYELRNALAYGESYEWYVMPRYRDNTPFYAAPPPKASFSVISHNAPEVTPEFPIQGSVLFAGETYELTADIQTSNEAAVSSIEWTIGNWTGVGQGASFTPTEQMAGSATVSYRVVDELGEVGSGSFNISIRNPRLVIQAASAQVRAGVPTQFSLQALPAFGVEDLVWTFTDSDGSTEELSGSSTVSYAFPKLGSFSVQVSGTAEDSAGNSRTVVSEPVSMQVVSAGNPQVAFVGPVTGSLFRVGESAPIRVTIESPHEVARTIWEVEGTRYTFDDTAQDEFTFTPDAALLGSSLIKTVQVSVSVIDEFDQISSVQRRNYRIVEPRVLFTNITGAPLTLQASFTPNITAEGADEIRWAVDGVSQSGISYTFSSPGYHTLSAQATWSIIGSGGNPEEVTEETEVEVRVIDSSPPEVAITAPARQPGIPLITGVEYDFVGIVEAAEIEELTWTIGDSGELSTDDGRVVYALPTGSERTSVTATFRAVNTDGVANQVTRTFAVVDPAARVIPPSQDAYPANTLVPVSGYTTAGVLWWRIASESEVWEVAGTQWDKRFSQGGIYTLIPGWEVNAAAPEGGSRLYRGWSDDQLELMIYYHSAPTFTEVFPVGISQRQVVNGSLTFSVSAESLNNREVQTTWEVLQGSTVVTRQTGENQFSYAGWEQPGIYVVRATVSDGLASPAVREWNVRIIRPEISVTFPEAGGTYGNLSFSAPVVTRSSVDSYQLVLGESTTPVPANFDWSSLDPGSYTLRAVGTYQAQVGNTAAVSETITSDPVSFTLAALQPPLVSITGVEPHDRLLSGEVYEITASAESPDGSDIQAYTWYQANQEIGQGSTLSYQPGSASGTVRLRVRVTDEFGLYRDEEMTLRVINPRIEVIAPQYLGQTGSYPVDAPVSFRHIAQDVDEVIWMLGGSDQGSSRFTFSQEGTYQVDARGLVAARMPDGTREIIDVASTGAREIQAFQRPMVSSLEVDPVNVYVGSSIQAQAVLEGSLEAVKSVEWLLGGRVVGSVDRPQTGTLTFSTILDVPEGKIFEVRVTDIFGRSASASRQVAGYNEPVLRIQSPREGQVFGPNQRIDLRGSLADPRSTGIISRYYWSLDGNEIPGTGSLQSVINSLTGGVYQLGLHSVDIFQNVISSEPVPLTVQSDLILTLNSPASDVTLVEGESLTARVTAQVLSSQVAVSSVAPDIIWYLNGNQEVGSGLSYQFSDMEPGNYTLQARYEAPGVSRQTRTVGITVEQLNAPRVTAPSAEQTIYYRKGETIPFQSEGYPNASYTWLLGQEVISRSRNFTFNPDGRTGTFQFSLQMEYQGIIQTVQHTVSLGINTPPQVSVSAPSLQFTGQPLSWVASAVDAEDGVLTPQVLFNGVLLDGSEQKILDEKDIGENLFMVRASDSLGATSQAQTSVSVQRGVESVTITSPAENQQLLVSRPVTLQSDIDAGQAVRDRGSFTWRISYIDAPQGGSVPLQLTGRNTSFIPEYSGEVRIEVVFSAPDIGIEPVRDERIVTVEQEPVTLALVWPYGTVVPEGMPLAPEAAGLTADQLDQGELEWYLNNQQAAPDELSAPNVSGTHTLEVRYLTDGTETARDAVTFTVNTAPQVDIITPTTASSYQRGSPVVLTATVRDDQTFEGRVRWYDGNMNLITQGSPAVMQHQEPGQFTLYAVAEDRYGLANVPEPGGSDAVTITLFDPLQITALTVNHGLGLYQIGASSALTGAVQLSGGVDPQVQWTITQGDLVQQSSGISFSLDPQLSGFVPGTVIIELQVIDRGQVRISQSSTVRIIEQPLVAITSPEPGTPFWAGSHADIQVLVSGFTQPAVRVSVDGNEVTHTSTILAENGGQQLYGLRIDCTDCSDESVYELVVEASQDGLQASDSYSMNVFVREPGIGILGAPGTYELNSEQPIVLSAELTGIDASMVLWSTSLSPDTYQGMQLDLSQLELIPGILEVRAQALDSSGGAAATAVEHIQMLGTMSLALQPDEEIITMNLGSDEEVTATAINRTGDTIQGDAIRWTSHLSGPFGLGERVQLGKAGLSEGEHVVTVEAAGAGGDVISSAFTLILRDTGIPPAESPPEESEDDELTEGDPPGQLRRTFGVGNRAAEREPTAEIATVSTVSGNVRLVRDGRSSPLTPRTSLYEGDEVQLRTNAAVVTMWNVVARGVETLRGSNTYEWDAAASSWVIK